jgi:hypothetical protein
MRPGPNGAGLSRKPIMVDRQYPTPVRIIHRFELDPVAPNAQRSQASSITA